MTHYKFKADRVLNLDETGIRVLADKKQRQIGQIVSGELGELVTFCEIIIATRTIISSVYVFYASTANTIPFLNGAPEGSLCLTNRSGWISAELFIQDLKYIQHYTLCNNHGSHISIEAINYCRDNDIVYLSCQTSAFLGLSNETENRF